MGAGNPRAVPSLWSAPRSRATLPGMPPDSPIAERLAHPVTVHFYRAVVGHADVWRQRMDATTNWAAATTAGMITFSFGAPEAAHVVLLLSLAFDVIFLLMESRRYQVYDLWRRRFRSLNQFLVAPVLRDGGEPSEDAIRAGLDAVAEDLGGTVPHLSLVQAIGYRIRRNYGFLFIIVLLAWLLKLALHPTAAGDVGEMARRAAIGAANAEVVIGSVIAFLLIALVLALRAPGEHMIRWSAVPSPYSQMVARSRRLVPWGRPPGAEQGRDV